MSGTPGRQLGIAAVGDEQLVSGLRLAGVSKYYVARGNGDVREEVRKALSAFVEEPGVGVVVILEDYREYVEDIITRIRDARRITPVIVELPSALGTKYKDVEGFYKAFIRKSIGFDIEI